MDLIDQGIHRLEPLFVSDPGGKRNPQRFAVQVVVAPDQMHLEDFAIAIVERRPHTDVGDSVVGLASPPDEDRVDPASRHDDPLSYLEVGGRDADLSPPPVARDYDAVDVVVSAQQGGSGVDVALRQGTADGCRANLTERSAPNRHFRHGEAELGTQFLESADRPRGSVSESKSVTDGDQPGPERGDEKLLDERSWGEKAHRIVEFENDDDIHAGILEQLEAPLERRQQLRRPIGSKDGSRVGPEGQGDSSEIVRAALQSE